VDLPLLLILVISWLHRRVLVLLILGPSRPWIALPSRLVAQQRYDATGLNTYPSKYLDCCSAPALCMLSQSLGSSGCADCNAPYCPYCPPAPEWCQSTGKVKFVYTHRSRPAPAADIGRQPAEQCSELVESGATHCCGFRNRCSVLKVSCRRRKLPPLSWVLRRTGISLLPVDVVGRHVFKVQEGIVEWGTMPLLHDASGFYPRSPALHFRCHTGPFDPYQVNGERKEKKDRAPAIPLAERFVLGIRAILSELLGVGHS
jgi:hypothetical protein